jgi:hypothetical protein
MAVIISVPPLLNAFTQMWLPSPADAVATGVILIMGRLLGANLAALGVKRSGRQFQRFLDAAAKLGD